MGHLHTPDDKVINNTRIINLGDWVENSTLCVENFDGRLEILEYSV